VVIVAFDSDVLIYAADDQQPLGTPVVRLLSDSSVIAIGSVLLRVETLVKPLRLNPSGVETENLMSILGRLTLIPCSDQISMTAVSLGVRYGLKGPDAIHLATAIDAGADQFLTNNRKDFPTTIREIDIVYPDAAP
jgi:predicted nucleic acid-binding protein